MKQEFTHYTDIKTYVDACYVLNRPAKVRWLYSYLDKKTGAFYMLMVIFEAIKSLTNEIPDGKWAVLYSQTDKMKIEVIPTGEQVGLVFNNREVADYFADQFSSLINSAWGDN